MQIQKPVSNILHTVTHRQTFPAWAFPLFREADENCKHLWGRSKEPHPF